MLPPGHIAAGFLVAKSVIYLTQPGLSSSQINHLLWWGAFFGFCPDLDMFFAFAKQKAFTLSDSAPNHRKFISHAPILWLLAGLGIYYFSSTEFWQLWGILLWLGSWSHFLLDTIQEGIMWGWPFTNKVFAIGETSLKHHIQEKNFFKFWLKFTHWYSTKVKPTFYVEIILIISALIILFK